MRFWRPVILISAVALIVAGLLAGYQRMRSHASTGVSSMLQTVTPAEEIPRGFIVWSSNRLGNHDIFRMDLPDRKISQLTRHPNTDYFPRISPDGRKIVFARSQQLKVSQRNQEPWDVMLLDLASGEEKRLAKNGNTPSWSSDGKKVYFQRGVFNMVEIDVDSGREQLLFSSGTGEVKKGAGLQTPAYNQTLKKMALTLRFTQGMTAIVGLDGEVNRVAAGCQLSWSKDGSFLYYVDYGGKMKNAFYLYDPATSESTKWLDLPGEYSHEYFPKLSNDEKYLVFGASKGGQEHDQADYEIFLWQVGTPVTTANRLTFDAGNDNWPDVYFFDESEG